MCRALPRQGLRFYSSGWVQSSWNHPEQSTGLLWLSSFKCKANFWKETKPNAGWVPAKSGASLSLWKGQKQLKDTCLWVHFCPIRSWQWERGRTREVMPWNKKFLIEREEKSSAVDSVQLVFASVASKRTWIFMYRVEEIQGGFKEFLAQPRMTLFSSEPRKHERLEIPGNGCKARHENTLRG